MSSRLVLPAALVLVLLLLSPALAAPKDAPIRSAWIDKNRIKVIYITGSIWSDPLYAPFGKNKTKDLWFTGGTK